MAEAPAREVTGEPSPPSALSQLKTGWKGLRSSLAKATATVASADQDASVEEGQVAARSSPPGSSGTEEPGAKASTSWKSVFKAAKKMVADTTKYDIVPEEGATIFGRPQDSTSEAGEDAPLQASSWANVAASRLKAQVAEAAEATRSVSAKGFKKAKSLDLGIDIGEHANVLRDGATRSFGRVADSAKDASASFAEKGKAAVDKAKDLQGKGLEAASKAKELGASHAAKAKDKAGAAAGAAKSKLVQAGASVKGLAALSMSPAKLAQFGGVFFIGMFLISMSFSFLPMLPISPQKFSLLFAFGSMTLLSSFAILKGPKAFFSDLLQREKLPFSGAYAVGLVGTLVATIVMRSYLLTAVFGLIQAIALLYFLASYVPGGQMLLNMCGSCCKKCARMICRRTMGGGGT